MNTCILTFVWVTHTRLLKWMWSNWWLTIRTPVDLHVVQVNWPRIHGSKLAAIVLSLKHGNTTCFFLGTSFFSNGPFTHGHWPRVNVFFDNNSLKQCWSNASSLVRKGRLADVLRYHWRSKHFLDVQATLPETMDMGRGILGRGLVVGKCFEIVCGHNQ